MLFCKREGLSIQISKNVFQFSLQTHIDIHRYLDRLNAMLRLDRDATDQIRKDDKRGHRS